MRCSVPVIMVGKEPRDPGLELDSNGSRDFFVRNMPDRCNPPRRNRSPEHQSSRARCIHSTAVARLTHPPSE